MSFDPFGDNGEGSSLERNDPITGAVKKAGAALNQQTQQQAKAAKQSFVDQLYGNVAPSESPDAGADPAQALAQAQNQSAPPTANNGLMPAVNPGEQGKLDDTRRQLAEFQKQHNESYFGPTFGEEAQKRRAQTEAEEKEIKEREEQEKLEAEEAKRQQLEESLQAFAQGKDHGKGPDQLGTPVSVTQAKTRTEINRGTSG